MKVLTFISDLTGCFKYRVDIPFNNLRRVDPEFSWTPYTELPNNPFGNEFSEICALMEDCDLVVTQRCTDFNVVKIIKRACDLLNKPFVYETDDDYINLPANNPALKDLGTKEAQDNYKRLLELPDLITVSTEELRNVIYPYNKNVKVFPNNVDRVYHKRSYFKEEVDPENPKLIKAPFKQFIGNGSTNGFDKHGLHFIPSYADHPKGKKRVVRIGYTGTPTHREDFSTIYYYLEKVVEKLSNNIWLLFIGDPYFYNLMTNAKKFKRMFFINPSQYDQYMFNIRNIDIGLAPLHPNVFNMSKSPIKAIEYASWGTPSILPNYVTYNREFTHGENCLLYNNGKDFESCLIELVNNHDLREHLGANAREHVENNRLEHLHSKERYDTYMELINSKPKLILHRDYKKVKVK